MLEILKGTLVPTTDTVGEEGQFYVRQFQGGRHTMSSEVYVLDSIRTDMENMQNPKTYYNWQQIFTANDVMQRIDTLRDNTEISMEDMHIELSDEIEVLKKQVAALDSAKEITPIISPIPAGALEHNKEYRLAGLGVISNLTFTLPDEIPENFHSKVIVRTASTGTIKFVHPENVTFVGDDCKNGKFNPLNGKRYEIVYDNIGKMSLSTARNYPYIILAKVTAF